MDNTTIKKLDNYFIPFAPFERYQRTFFTKFLAVEGVPENGDVIMSSNGVCVVTGGKARFGLPLYNFAYIKENIKNYRKAGLFLCSLNFSEVFMHYDGIELKKEPYPFEEDGNIENWLGTIGAVHGEVSPEALWVKEGQYYWKSDFEIRTIPLFANKNPKFANWERTETWSTIHDEVREKGLRERGSTSMSKYSYVKFRCKQCETLH
jgi:hypothetical protein